MLATTRAAAPRMGVPAGFASTAAFASVAAGLALPSVPAAWVSAAGALVSAALAWVLSPLAGAFAFVDGAGPPQPDAPVVAVEPFEVATSSAAGASIRRRIVVRRARRRPR